MDISGRQRTSLLKPLILLTLPVLAEHLLHILVGITDTYLANNILETRGLTGAELEKVHATNAASGAAVGSVTYIMWFLGMVVSAIGTGATAIIARGIGARHRRLANKVCGQAIFSATAFAILFAIFCRIMADPFARWSGLPPDSAEYFASYIRILCFGIPFALLMFTANSCLRGAGDTLTPAIAMMTIDVVNLLLSTTLTWGLFGMPQLGFRGIAIGTTIAYIVGGTLQLIVLLSGRGGIKLYMHRLRPDWNTIKRILRIGLPSGSESLLMWLGNIVVLQTVNQQGNIASTAHNVAIRIESLSYMSGFAVATAVSTMVGQNLGANNPERARRAAYYGYTIGGVIMGLLGIVFIVFGHWCAGLFSDDPKIVETSASCLFLTGFIQIGFAAAIIFSAALRGAGDTKSVMILNLTSILGIRCLGVYILSYFSPDLPTIWIILCSELVIRGAVMYGRFISGKWVHIKV